MNKWKEVKSMSVKFISVEKNEYIDRVIKWNASNPFIPKKLTPIQSAIKSLKGKKLHTLVM